MGLFEERTRSDGSVQRASESTYKFLSRVDDAVFADVRALFDAWFDRFAARQPLSETKSLAGRFRSKNDGQFYAAFWELYLHELHVRLGFNVEVHPESATDARPDFFVSRGGRGFYLEAVMPSSASGASDQPGSVSTVMEQVGSAFHPDFFLKVRFIASGNETPKKREVVQAVEGWLGSLTWDEWWLGGLSVDREYPESELPVRDWVIGLRALPRSPKVRGDRTFPTIGIYPSFGGFPDAVATDIGPKLDEKASKYGDLDAPHVIAVWVMSPLASSLTAPQALFGSAVEIEEGTHPTGLHLRPPTQSGLWTPDRPNRGRVSAVLAANSFTFNYSAVARVMPHLWHNPWAHRPLNSDLLPFAASAVSVDELEVTSWARTVEPAALFDVPDDWPGKPFARR